MGTRTYRTCVTAALAFIGLAACAAQTQLAAQPTPAGDPGARFMRDMIAHHAQALDMAALVPERTSREDIRRLALRIEAGQSDEIALMRRWLSARGHALPEDHGHGSGHEGHTLMPGMLNAEQMRRLTGATGETFDRLFLESMIAHHQGALVMVADLFATDSAGQDVELFHFASSVDADQRAEIARMRQLLHTGG